mmetsp:Transcript_10020/g.28178  ORF Transcript_10020/g.28178 Transcript_10020/m.28178 type:complete len:443 (-) Transcript_10020:74-1402(-)
MAGEKEVMEATLEYARKMDEADEFRKFRGEFHIPRKTVPSEDEASRKIETLYFCGNSLGCLPKRTRALVNEELDVWADLGVEGHFSSTNPSRPWVITDEFVQEESASVVGAKPHEVAVMNSLTVNLHLFMISFYKPTETRFKIIMEGHAFPSDRYAVRSQVEMRGQDPDAAIIEITPRAGEHTLRTEDIVARIEQEGSSVALVMFSGVQYYTGQFFDLQALAAAAHKVGAYAGFDLAHAVGNVPLKLHDWGADFACWCTYKYLNSGPGNIGGAFVHERHGAGEHLDRLAGWWGHKLTSRFDMDQPFEPIPGAFGWRLSNPPVLCVAALLGSLQVFQEAGGVVALRAKSEKLTGYLEFLLNTVLEKGTVQIITPSDPVQRGCQLSLLFLKDSSLEKVEKAMLASPPICDTRKPNVIRVAPTPLYNSFEDVFRFVEWLAVTLKE